VKITYPLVKFISGMGWLSARLNQYLHLPPHRVRDSGLSQADLSQGDGMGYAGRGLFSGDSSGRHNTACASISSLLDKAYGDDYHKDREVKQIMVQKQTGWQRKSMTGDTTSLPSAMWVEDLLQVLEGNPPEELSPVRKRQRDKAIALIHDEELLAAAYSFNLLPLQGRVEGNRLRVGGETLDIYSRLPKRGELTALGIGAYTLGPRLEVRMRQLFADKRAGLAHALDSLANEMLLLLGQRMQRDLLASVRQQSLILGPQLQIEESFAGSPALIAVLRLVGAQGIGINLHQWDSLWPQKSTALVYAVGRNLPKLSLRGNQDYGFLRSLSGDLVGRKVNALPQAERV
jgi:hypothetical protein